MKFDIYQGDKLLLENVSFRQDIQVKPQNIEFGPREQSKRISVRIVPRDSQEPERTRKPQRERKQAKNLPSTVEQDYEITNPFIDSVEIESPAPGQSYTHDEVPLKLKIDTTVVKKFKILASGKLLAGPFAAKQEFERTLTIPSHYLSYPTRKTAENISDPFAELSLKLEDENGNSWQSEGRRILLKVVERKKHEEGAPYNLSFDSNPELPERQGGREPDSRRQNKEGGKLFSCRGGIEYREKVERLIKLERVIHSEWKQQQLTEAIDIMEDLLGAEECPQNKPEILLALMKADVYMGNYEQAANHFESFLTSVDEMDSVKYREISLITRSMLKMLTASPAGLEYLQNQNFELEFARFWQKVLQGKLLFDLNKLNQANDNFKQAREILKTINTPYFKFDRRMGETDISEVLALVQRHGELKIKQPDSAELLRLEGEISNIIEIAGISPEEYEQQVKYPFATFYAAVFFNELQESEDVQKASLMAVLSFLQSKYHLRSSLEY
ncbi:MAG: hypothetical protein ACLFN5_06880 [bacterium]